MKTEETEIVQACTAVRTGQSQYSAIVQIFKRADGSFLLVDNTSPLLAWFFPWLKNKKYTAYVASQAFTLKNFDIWERAWSKEEYWKHKREYDRQHITRRSIILGANSMISLILLGFTGGINTLIQIDEINLINEIVLVCILVLSMIFSVIFMSLGKRYYLQRTFIDKFNLNKSKVKVIGDIFNIKYKAIYAKYIIMLFMIIILLLLTVYARYRISATPQLALILGCFAIFGCIPDFYGPGYFMTRSKKNQIQLPTIKVKIIKE